VNEKDLGKSLLRGEAAPDVGALTQQVLRRDRWRVFWLATACVMAWMLVVALPWSTVLPMLAKVVQQVTAANGPTPTTADAAQQQREQWIELLQIVKKGTIAAFLSSMASMLMAAVCTVALIVASRRATLRQVNARLAEISEQLKALAAKQP
jgi:hypothetical protein